MPARFTYLANDDDQSLVMQWFRSLSDDVSVGEQPHRTILYFRDMAAQPLSSVGQINPEKTPLVFVESPRNVRGALRSTGEVFFSPSPLRSQFPELDKIRKRFAAWLQEYDVVFSIKEPKVHDWDYYLEGGIQNVVDQLFALPGALRELKAGRYFVHHRDPDGRLDVLKKTLRLRGIEIE